MGRFKGNLQGMVKYSVWDWQWQEIRHRGRGYQYQVVIIAIKEDYLAEVVSFRQKVKRETK